jgi:hypothetical protein
VTSRLPQEPISAMVIPRMSIESGKDVQTALVQMGHALGILWEVATGRPDLFAQVSLYSGDTNEVLDATAALLTIEAGITELRVAVQNKRAVRWYLMGEDA